MTLIKGIPCTIQSHADFKEAQSRLSKEAGKKLNMIDTQELILKEFFKFKGWVEVIVP